MKAIPKELLRTSDVTEAVDAVSRIYCRHEVEIRGKSRPIDAKVEVIRGGIQPVIGLKYSIPIRIHPGHFRNLMLMQTCIDGSGTAAQADSRAMCRRDQTLPLSPGLPTELEFDGRFAQRSVRIDIERLETLCSRWINAPLERSLRFELRPFSPPLEKAWTHAVDLLLTYERFGIELPQAASASFDEFMLSLLLAQHPHNYSNHLDMLSTAAAPRTVQEAERVMRSAGPETTLSEIASQLGVSLRSLELGFRKWRQSTPTQYLRRLRLDAARAQLLTPVEFTTVTSVALGNGFFHPARFSAYYRAVFNEMPGQTLRRSRTRSK